MNQNQIIKEIQAELDYIFYLEDKEILKALMQFQSRHKYFLFCFSIEGKNKLGRMLGESDKKTAKKVLTDYKIELDKVFDNLISIKQVVDSLTHIAGYFKKDLEKTDYKKLLEKINALTKEINSTQSLINEIKSYAILFDKEYILEQSLLKLSEIVD